jgi:hypothetical protein
MFPVLCFELAAPTVIFSAGIPVVFYRLSSNYVYGKQSGGACQSHLSASRFCNTNRGETSDNSGRLPNPLASQAKLTWRC